MQTVIKWPGGKTTEYSIIQNYIPQYDRYIEPFFGGGAVFFNMCPQKAVVNDISYNLMQFYSYVKEQNQEFKTCLYSINDEWNVIKTLAGKQAEVLIPLFISYRNGRIGRANASNVIDSCCNNTLAAITNNEKAAINGCDLSHEMRRMVTDKFFRTANNEIKNQASLCENDLSENIVTGFLSGYYMYMRSLLNCAERHGQQLMSDEHKSAIFYFVREFCYGSMFRYNKLGDFNIPYGGIGYNNKDFKKKIDLLFSNDIQLYFKDTDIYSMDFEKILGMATARDFVFLDPPYDTDFSDYENRSFGEKDQRRLADVLHETKAKFLLIIKNTPLISELYMNNGYAVHAFDNKYAYCVKGRNDRNAVHLIVTNYS